MLTWRKVTFVSTLSLALALVVGSALAQPRRGRARATRTGPVHGEVLIVLASEAAGTIDPRLAQVRALRRPPFDSYRSMALLSSPRLALRVGHAETVRLPNGRHVRLLLREITEEGRYRVQVEVNRPGQHDYLPQLNVVASPGDPFFIAGQSFRDGTLVIGIRLD